MRGVHLLEELFGDEGQERRVEAEQRAQRLPQGRPRRGAELVGVARRVPEPVLDELDVVVAELGPEEVIERFAGDGVVVGLEATLDGREQSLEPAHDPAILGCAIGDGNDLSGIEVGRVLLDEARDVPELQHELAARLDVFLVIAEVVAEMAARGPEAQCVGAVLVDDVLGVVLVEDADLFGREVALRELLAVLVEAPARDHDVVPRDVVVVQVRLHDASRRATCG